MQWNDFFGVEACVQNGALELTGRDAWRLCFRVLEPDILHITFLTQGNGPVEPGQQSLVHADLASLADPQVEWIEERGKTCILTGTLKVTVQNNPLTVQYETADGTPIALDWKYTYTAKGTAVRHEMLEFQHEHVYGLGDLQGALNRNRRKFVVDAGARKGFPFYLCWQPEKQIAYGLLYDNLFPAHFYINQFFGDFAGRRAYQAQTGKLDMYFILGPSIPEVVKKLTCLVKPFPNQTPDLEEPKDDFAWNEFGLGVDAESNRQLSGMPADETRLARLAGMEPSLKPYIRSLLLEQAQTGALVQRPLVCDFPFDPKVVDESFEFMLGANLLAAPLTNPRRKKQNVCLPDAANWFDFRSGQFHPGGQSISLPVDPFAIPLFVPEGGMIPVAGEKESSALRLLCYPRQQGKSELLFHVRAGDDNQIMVIRFEMDSAPNEIRVTGTLETKGARLPKKKIEVVLPTSESRRLVTGGLCIKGDQADSMRALASTSSPE